jgi:hypothetical protein
LVIVFLTISNKDKNLRLRLIQKQEKTKQEKEDKEKPDKVIMGSGAYKNTALPCPGGLGKEPE